MEQFNFIYERVGLPTMTLFKSGLSFNKPFIEKLNYARRVNVGYDRVNKKLAIKAVDELESDLLSYDFFNGKSTKMSTLLKSFIVLKEVKKIIGCPHHLVQNYKFPATFDEEKKLFIVDLEKPLEI